MLAVCSRGLAVVHRSLHSVQASTSSIVPRLSSRKIHASMASSESVHPSLQGLVSISLTARHAICAVTVHLFAYLLQEHRFLPVYVTQLLDPILKVAHSDAKARDINHRALASAFSTACLATCVAPVPLLPHFPQAFCSVTF
jgi:hypothetical protein